MLPQPDQQKSQKDDAFAFRLEMLKKELDFIDSSIRKIDDIGNSIKNWAILSWTGAIAIILGKPELYGYVVFFGYTPIIIHDARCSLAKGAKTFYVSSGNDR